MRFPRDLTTLDQLEFTPWTLLFFLDDTGDETGTDKSQPFFGMGGCAVLGGDMERLVNQPWREVRRVITGSPDAPLHASEMRPPFDPTHIAALTAFFADNRFMRFGVSCDRRVELPASVSLTQALLPTLQNRLNGLLSRCWVTDVAVIFEHSERLEKAIKLEFGGFCPQQFGRILPWTPCFMPKWANEPALEVADFVAHTVGSQARKNFDQGHARTHRLDFRAVFHSVDRMLVSGTHVLSLSLGNKPGNVHDA
jgi:hypothetical protein